MESCEDGNLMSVDASVGGLVWVRRRNGSWWPGRVLGPEELPEELLTSPKSGTPIKLLGREDGSIDWYNLEKSKRIKAFRCGEYDECIEKAKASALRSNKKSSNEGKYVRREDAILHALEIEKARFSNGDGVCGGMTNSIETCDTLTIQAKSMYGLHKGLGHAARKLSSLDENSTQEVSQSVISFEHPNNLTGPDVQFRSRKRWKTPNDSEDDTSEGIKRMRDLREIGYGLVSKRKTSTGTHPKGSLEQALLNSASLGECNTDYGLSSTSQINECKQSFSSLKIKRSDRVQSYEKLRRKYRRRPLAKLCEGSRVIIPSYCHWLGPFPGQSSGHDSKQNMLRDFKSASRKADYSMTTENSPDCSGTSCEEVSFEECGRTHNTALNGTILHSETRDSELSSHSGFVDNDCSDVFFNVPLVMRDFFDGEEKQYTSSSHDGVNSPCNEGRGESGCIGSSFQVNHKNKKRYKMMLEQNCHGTDFLKCQALNRNNGSDGFLYRADRYDASLNNKVQDRLSVGSNSRIPNGSFDESVASENCTLLVKSTSVPEVGDGPQDETIPADLACNGVVEKRSVGELELDETDEDVNELSNSLSDSKDQVESLTVDVPVSSMPPEESLQFNQVCYPKFTKYQILKPVKSISVDSILYDVELNVQATYQGPHVPLVSLMSKLNGKAIVGHPVAVEVLEDGFYRSLVSRNDYRPATGRIDQLLKRRILRENLQLQPKLNAANHKITKSSLKNMYSHSKKSGFSPRKIRRLSSITVDRRDREDRKPVVEKIGGPAVACVPLRLVFSRINEALSCTTRSANGS
ncbi:uncharacterized protein At1g51745-like isoform X1 [Typha angustifolia]|uniref:uncharacterized protein At1g51745-like isoform X1 n=1 Tax=Typha angustifolia TaxID=59011 RepID=UPI003C2D98E4